MPVRKTPVLSSGCAVEIPVSASIIVLRALAVGISVRSRRHNNIVYIREKKRVRNCIPRRDRNAESSIVPEGSRKAEV